MRLFQETFLLKRGAGKGMEIMNNFLNYNDFSSLLKERNGRKVWASISHYQTHPEKVSSFAILKLGYNGSIYFRKSNGKIIEINDSMPGFYIYRETNIINQYEIDRNFK